MCRLDRDDIFRAATSDKARAAEGATIPGVGTILYRGGAEAQRTMVDLHEQFHMELNGANSFGLLLGLVGGGHFDLEGSDRSRLLESLIDLCRATHEVYATTLSVWPMQGERRSVALADYPDYEGFLEIGERLVGGYPVDSMVASALLIGACIAAMQVPLGQLLGHRADWPSQPLATQPSLCPDERFVAILKATEADGLDFSWISREVAPRWLTRDEHDEHGSREYERAYHSVLIRAYHQYAWALTRRDIPVLPWDAHLEYRRIAMHARVDPGTFSKELLTQAETEALEIATYAASNPHHAIKISEKQSLHRSHFQGALKAGLLKSILAPLPTDLSLDDFVHRGKPVGLHIVTRPVEALIASYSVSEQQAESLRLASLDGTLTALRMVVEGPDGPLTLLGVMNSADDLEALINVCIADRAVAPWIYTTISMSCIFSREYRERWLTALRLATYPVLLADLPPSVFLAAENDPDGFNFAVFHFLADTDSPSDIDPLKAVAFERNRAQGTIERYVAFMASSVLINAFTRQLEALPKATYNLRPLSHSPAADAMLHLAIEEPEFHFHGLRYIEPSSPHEPPVTPEEMHRWLKLAEALRLRQMKWQE